MLFLIKILYKYNIKNLKKCVLVFVLPLSFNLSFAQAQGQTQSQAQVQAQGQAQGQDQAQVEEIFINTDNISQDNVINNSNNNIIMSYLQNGGFAGKVIHEVGVFSLVKNNIGEEKALDLHHVGISLWNAFSTKGLVALLGASSGISIFVGAMGGVLVYKAMELPKQLQLSKLKQFNKTQLALTQGRHYQNKINYTDDLSDSTFLLLSEVNDPIEGLRKANLPELILTPMEKNSY